MCTNGKTAAKERKKQELPRHAGSSAAMQRSPVDKLPFTLGDIKKAIPPHCFRPSVIKSFSYWSTTSPLPWASCTLLCHRRHHANTGSMENDEVYVAKKKSALPWYTPYVFGNPVGRLVYIVLQLTLAWPLYLGFNLSGQPYPCFTSHYDPYNPLFSDQECIQVLILDAGILAMLFALYKLMAAFGFWWVVRLYGVPLLILNALFILITYLHHTHWALPQYDSSEWQWLRGSLSTIDHDYGILNHVLHNVTDTHVLHHLFPTMPHYHEMEATKAMRPILGEYYKLDPTSIVKATWREAKECMYVEPGNCNGIYWYNKKF
ncbi:hypothetical protein E2562_025879 [Oryza meyeriana var. granulata]|uniref:Fatty acid desaturase domain-containing protein n=1 Tax=Oryza meyeriana var. granulata TaxID=110450 RepID=A0A6G1D812_9ORYZ|nr:hypothetical protein E2562_025879 [Oryza meyeriana var. granulata]